MDIVKLEKGHTYLIWYGGSVKEIKCLMASQLAYKIKRHDLIEWHMKRDFDHDSVIEDVTWCFDDI